MLHGVKVQKEITEKIKNRMLSLVEKNSKIKQEIISHDYALEYFERIGRNYSKLLIESNNDPEVLIDVCDDYLDIHHATLVGNIGQIGTQFDLLPHDKGMILIDPYKKTVFDDKLIPLYHDYNEWGKVND